MLYDYDGAETPVLVDMQYQGNPRKLLIEANRNGFIYFFKSGSKSRQVRAKSSDRPKARTPCQHDHSLHTQR